ncbi:MAG: AAA family ATPase [Desulfobacterales bacterium]
MYKRILNLPLSTSETCFLWGPRQTGKSTLLNAIYPDAKRYDLLLSDQYQRLLLQPSLIREECLAIDLKGENQVSPIIVDEVQKIPILLDEIHWLIENRKLRFILCGSSARKVKRGRSNLLGGRAVRYELHPLVYPEVPDFSLEKALNTGLLPRHYQSANPHQLLLQAYIGDYLKEEIAAEALTRNIPAFSRFLQIAALTNGELTNYNNIASECGVSAPTVKEYFLILEDTLIGRMLPAFRKRAKRRLIGAPKFFFFDIGIVAHLTRRGKVKTGSELFGRAFEHLVYMELIAHSGYSGINYPIAYWKTASGFEVDFVLGNHEIAIEVKGAEMVTNKHLKGIRAFKEEYQARSYIVVSMDTNARRTEDGIEILPWHIFLDRLWANEIINT